MISAAVGFLRPYEGKMVSRRKVAGSEPVYFEKTAERASVDALAALKTIALYP